MQLRQHQVTTTQGTAGAAQSTQHKSKLRRKEIGLSSGCFAAVMGSDERAEEIDEVCRWTAPGDLVDGECICHIAGAVVDCDYFDCGAFVKILAFREPAWIEEYLIALVVSWIIQNQRSGVQVQ